MSPAPQLPNGKPTSPFAEKTNPMGTQQIAAQTVSSKDPKAAAQAASDMRNVVRRKLTGYVGFANLPNQWHRKSVRKGFNFNVMVVGACWRYTALEPRNKSDIVQVNRVWGSLPWSIRSSTPLYTHPRSAPARIRTSNPRPSQSSRSALISRKMAYAFD